jgi:hypothetical protein
MCACLMQDSWANLTVCGWSNLSFTSPHFDMWKASEGLGKVDRGQGVVRNTSPSNFSPLRFQQMSPLGCSPSLTLYTIELLKLRFYHGCFVWPAG